MTSPSTAPIRYCAACGAHAVEALCHGFPWCGWSSCLSELRALRERGADPAFKPSSVDATVPCGWCGEATMMLGTRMCEGCWAIDSRLRTAGAVHRPKILAVILQQHLGVDVEALRSLFHEATPGPYRVHPERYDYSIRTLGGNAQDAGEAPGEAFVRKVKRAPDAHVIVAALACVAQLTARCHGLISTAPAPAGEGACAP